MDVEDLTQKRRAARETPPAETAASGPAEEAGTPPAETAASGSVEETCGPLAVAGGAGAAAAGPSGPAEVVSLEQHQRLLAEFDNYRKRANRERAELELRGTGNLIVRLLPLLDDLERARASLAAGDAADRQGLLIILGRLAEILQREGLTQVEASPGTVFDPEKHEAVLTIPTAKIPEGSVAEVLENGYRYGDRLLRPTRVAVARSPEHRSPAEEEDTG